MLFVPRRMQLDKRNYFFTYIVVCDPSHVPGKPNIQEIFMARPMSRGKTIQNPLWPVVC